MCLSLFYYGFFFFFDSAWKQGADLIWIRGDAVRFHTENLILLERRMGGVPVRT